MFQPEERNDRSRVWLPISASTLAAALVALVLCPVPRSETVTGPMALFLAVVYVLAVVVVGAGMLYASNFFRAGDRGAARRALPLFCSIAAWLAPIVAFYRRDSLWAVVTVSVLAILGSRLIYRHRLAVGVQIDLSESTETETETSPNGRALLLQFTAILLQIGALFALASMARAATILVGITLFIISFVYQLATAWRPTRSRYQRSSHAAILVALAMVFVAASLTPYLAIGGEDEGAEGTMESKQPMSRASRRSDQSKAGLLQSVKAFFGTPKARQARSENRHAQRDKPFPPAPYPVLQALFGERKPGESEMGPLEKKRSGGRATALVAADSYPGMILRPPIDDHAPIVPPIVRRTVLETRSNARRDDPVSIPFYGAYWFFRASDGTLPADSIESRGDPASVSFKTTDFSPIAMEARQSFGTQIDLACCRSVELVISNGDRRPATVVVELILANTSLPGKPQQSLGICEVNSTQRWSPDDNRPPVTETLTFRVPPVAAIQSFDEATIRFVMQSPRERWSAKMAVLKIRLIPRGL